MPLTLSTDLYQMPPSQFVAQPPNKLGLAENRVIRNPLHRRNRQLSENTGKLSISRVKNLAFFPHFYFSPTPASTFTRPSKEIVLDSRL